MDEQLGTMGVAVCRACGETAPVLLVERGMPRVVLGVRVGRRRVGWSLECSECGDRHDVSDEEGRGWARGLELSRRYQRSETMRRR